MELFSVKMDQTVMKSSILNLRFVFAKDKQPEGINKTHSGVT